MSCRKLRQSRRVSVVGKLRHDHAFPAGPGPGKSHRQFVGLASRATEHADTKLVRKLGRQPLRVIERRLVQITGVGVEGLGLFADGFDHVRMAMADMGDVVVNVQVPAARCVVQPDAFAPDDVQRRIVEEPIRRPQQAPAPSKQSGARCVVHVE